MLITESTKEMDGKFSVECRKLVVVRLLLLWRRSYAVHRREEYRRS